MKVVKKIAAPRKKKQTVFSDTAPEDAAALNEAFCHFLQVLCVSILEWPKEQFTSKPEQPLSLNTVLEQIIILKSDRDAWRTRCESIEAAFNESNE